MKRIRWLLMPFAAALLTLAVACGGDDSNGGSSSGGGGSGSTVSNELDLSRSAQNLADVKSFRFDMTLKMDFGNPSSGSSKDDLGALFMAMFSNIKAEGAYVAPDRFEMKTTLFGEEMHIIQVGQRAWMKEGSRWVPSDPDDSFFGSPAEMPFEFLPKEVLKGAKTKSENVNGVKALRYSFDKAAIQKLARETGEDLGDFDEISEANLDVWVSEDNVPVKMTMKMKGKSEGSDVSFELDYNIKDLNSSSIKIEPPL